MDATVLQRFLSRSAATATRNEIRELLKLMARPEIISLAGGMPSPEAFPVDLLAELLPSALRAEGRAALQYGPTEGDLALRTTLIETMTTLEGGRYADLTPEEVLITSASQQGLDLCSRLFLSPGDAVVCGLPSYLGALGAFTACGARLSGVPLDREGLRTDLLEARLIELRRRGIRPKLLYVVPDFQNPSGVTMSLRRRRDVLDIAAEFDLLVLEDSPYRQLRYVGEPRPTIGELDRDGRVISLFTVSKVFCPGLRLGWVVAVPEIIQRLVIAKQPVDLCTSGLSQLIVREYLRSGALPGQLARLRELYDAKRQRMLAALEREFPPELGVRWTRPEGGLFLWLTLPEGLDAAELLRRALDRDVAFVTGRAFHCDGSGRNTARLNFSYPTPDQIDTAVARLAGCVAEMAADLDEPTQEPADVAPEPLVSGHYSLEQLAWFLVQSETLE